MGSADRSGIREQNPLPLPSALTKLSRMGNVTSSTVQGLTIPRVNATQAATLARLLVAAGNANVGANLPASVLEALNDLEATYPRLQDALVAPRDEMPGVRQADVVEDNAWGTLRDWLASWSRLPVGHPSGDVARKVLEAVLDGGKLDFLSLRVEEERTISDAKLNLIAERGYDADIESLGGAAILDFLRSVNTAYGKAIDALGAADPSAAVRNIRAPFDDTRASLREYLVAVQGTVKRGKPETLELAAKLLRPLIDWSRGSATPTTPAAPASPAAPATPAGQLG
jgi:hypothetical protein